MKTLNSPLPKDNNFHAVLVCFEETSLKSRFYVLFGKTRFFILQEILIQGINIPNHRHQDNNII